MERRADPPRHHQRYWRYSEFIRPLEQQQGILVRRLAEQLEMETITYHYSAR